MATKPKTEEMSEDIKTLVAELVAKQLAEAKEAEAKAAKAAEDKETEAERKRQEELDKKAHEMVPYFIPYVEGEPDEETVGFNGKLYKIKKGVEVEIPRFILEVLVDSNKKFMEFQVMKRNLENVELNA